MSGMSAEQFIDADFDSYQIYADWLEERGTPAPSWWIGPASYAGIYSGIGIGIGSGRGRGSGSGRGIGIGIGSGRGRGSGIGSGIGSGSGRGRGRGIGRGSGNNTGGMGVEQGKKYLVHQGDWHTFVGRLVRQVSPLLYEFDGVSKIRETNNGDCWHELAAGDERLREAAEYVHYETRCFMPLSIAAFEWVGKLPSEKQIGRAE